jgi:class 3 adenylate cyclase/tetratricopeptide (TPR) repeat protein
MAVCPDCGAENREGARFCDTCGAPLAAAGPEPGREERKVVTVLFADLVGFTSRAEQMDPEDVRAVLEPYHAHLRSELERFGGTVEKFIGDAVMALFGAPTAHEDDPERAVRAALAIRDWVPEQSDLQVRIAVTTGEALVALGARPSEGEGMASGDVVNTAARLQSAAPVNGILVDETTYRATERALIYEEREPVEAKGKAEPIPVWEAVEARSRFGVDVTRGSGGPLIGREKEVDLLRDALTRARQEVTPQLVTLVGVPGIGKSRLVAELFSVVEADPELIFWRQGRCLPYGEGVTYWALGEMVKAHAGILETDTEEQAEGKLTASIEDAGWVAGHLRPLVGLAEDVKPQAGGQAEAFAAWRKFFESIAERGPLVLVFEDLHWADDSLLDFVDHLVDWASGVPLLVVCTARPELLSRRPGWGGGKPNAATVSLSPLSDEETALLVHALLGTAVLPAEVQTRLIDHAGGNPLYTEEFARMVSELDSGDEGIRLPESIQGIIAARLDALPLDEKLLLQDAAVAGKVFWLGALERIGRAERSSAEQLLHELERKEFVRRERRSSVGEETQYAFRHLLVRDVAYSQIPRSARVDKHRAAAEWIESLSRAEDYAELVAHHYLSALEFAAATGQELPEVADQARVALRNAGDRAYALSSLNPAMRFYGAALDLWPAGAPDRPYLLLRYGRVLEESALEGEQELRQASTELESTDPEAAAEAEILLADLFWRRGQREPSSQHRSRAEDLIKDVEESKTKTFVVGQLARFHMLASESEPAIRLGWEALEMARRLGLEDLEASILNSLGAARSLSGDPEGLEMLEEAVVLSRRANTIELNRVLNNFAFNLIVYGRVREAVSVVDEMYDAATSLGNPDWIRWAEDKRMSTSYFLGRWDVTAEITERLVAEVEAGTPHYLAGSWRMFLGRVRFGRGDRVSALALARRGLDEARQAGDPQILGPIIAWNAVLEEVAAEALFDELIELWQRLGSGVISATAAPDAAIVALRLGRSRDYLDAAAGGPPEPWISAGAAYVEENFLGAADQYREIGALPPEAEARMKAAAQLIESGDWARGEEELEHALAFWRSVGATTYINEVTALRAAVG